MFQHFHFQDFAWTVGPGGRPGGQGARQPEGRPGSQFQFQNRIAKTTNLGRPESSEVWWIWLPTAVVCSQYDYQLKLPILKWRFFRSSIYPVRKMPKKNLQRPSSFYRTEAQSKKSYRKQQLISLCVSFNLFRPTAPLIWRGQWRHPSLATNFLKLYKSKYRDVGKKFEL